VYKDSEVWWLGDIPAHWDVKRLRFISQWSPSQREVQALADESEVSFVPMESVGEGGGLSLELTKPIADVKAGYTYFRDGDIVVAKITPCFENGKGALAEGLVNGVAFGTTELYVVRPTAKCVERKFLLYVTLSDPFRRLGAACMYGAGGQKRVPESFVRDFAVPLPPAAEQRAIAAFLDRETARLDVLLAKKERLIALLQEQRTAITAVAVVQGLDSSVRMKDSGVENLGQVPSHWTVKRLKHVAQHSGSGIQMGPFGSMLKDLSTNDTGYRVYGQENTISGDFSAGARWVTAQQYTELCDYIVREGDIVLTRKGSLGNARVFPPACEPGIIDSDTIRVRTDADAIDTAFLVLLLHEAPYVGEQIGAVRRGAVLGGLNTATIANLVLALPPLDEQRRIVASMSERCRCLERLQAAVHIEIDRLHELRNSLISSAVTGKIDVREEAA
jgi:type I restriction enzyme S subunit